MHVKNVLHRDIKSDNILYKKDGEIKIADLGLSVFLHEQKAFRNTKIGTSNWFSPEIAKGVYYSKEVDVWAFGCFAYELATGNPPFVDYQNSSLLTAIQTKEITPIPSRWGNDFKDFIDLCLKKDPQERNTID